MLLTKNNQTPLDLAQEFVNNVRNISMPKELVDIGVDWAEWKNLKHYLKRLRIR